jgi:hypothetical protein
MVGCLFLGGGRFLYGPLPDGPFHDPVDPAVVALIDQLRNVSDEGPGMHSTAWASGFIAVDEEFAFGGGIIGSQTPSVDPAMRDLVRMGVRALPDLLNHLSDARKTQLKVWRNGGFGGGAWHSDEFDPRYRAAGRRPARVNQEKEESIGGEYTLRVGDLCFVAIGQIVNRRLWVLRYQPSACLVINSPVQTPELACAVRKDWAGLTPEQHRQSFHKAGHKICDSDLFSLAGLPALGSSS